MKIIVFFTMLIVVYTCQVWAQEPQEEDFQSGVKMQCFHDPSLAPPVAPDFYNKFTDHDTVNICIVLATSEGHSAYVDYKLYYKKLDSLLKDFYTYNSNGKYTIETNIIVKNINSTAGIVEVFTLEGGNDWPIISATPEQIRKVLDSADTRFDFNQADRNKDGYVDNLFFCVVRQNGDGLNGKAELGISEYITTDTRIGTTAQKIIISNGARCSVNDGVWKMLAILIHEQTHTLFRFPDIDHSEADNTWYAMGSFDGGFGSFSGVPSPFNPLFRHKLGWIDFTEVNNPGTITLKNCETDSSRPHYLIANLNIDQGYNRFLLTSYDATNKNILWTKNFPLPRNPINIDDYRGVLLYRLYGFNNNAWDFQNKRIASISLEAAHGKWEWQNEQAAIKDQKFRKLIGASPIPNITNGLDSLSLRGTYTWTEWINGFEYNRATYTDFRIGSESCMFTPYSPKDFNALSNPSSNFIIEDQSLGYPKGRTSDIQLANLRVEDGEMKIDLKIGTDAHTIKQDVTFKAEHLIIDKSLTIEAGVRVKILPGSKIFLRNNAILAIKQNAELTADGVTIDFGTGTLGGVVCEGGSLVLKNSIILGGLTGISGHAPRKVEVSNCTISGAVYGLLLANYGSAPIYVERNTIISQNTGILIANGISASITKNTINSRSGIMSFLVPELNIFSNNIINNGQKDLTGILSYTSSGRIYGNNIEGFYLGLSAINGMLILGKNRIFENLQYGLLSSNQNLTLLRSTSGQNLTEEDIVLGGCNEIFNNGVAHSASGLRNSEIHIDNARVEFNSGSQRGYNSIMDDRAGVPFNTSCLIDGTLSGASTLNASKTFWGYTTEFGALSTRFVSVPVSYNPVLNRSPFGFECSNATNNYVIYTDRHNQILDTVYLRPKEFIDLTALEELYKKASECLSADDLDSAAHYYLEIIENYGRDDRAFDAYYSLMNILQITDQAPVTWDDFRDICLQNKLLTPDPDMIRFLENMENNRLILLGYFGSVIAKLDSVISNSGIDSYDYYSANLEKTILSNLLVFISNDSTSSPSKALHSGSTLGRFHEDIKKLYFDRFGEPENPNQSTNVIPSEYELLHNYPNPFNPHTRIEYRIAKYGFVTIKLFDILGNEITTLVSEYKNAGEYGLDFNATGLSSGTYFYRISINGFIQSRKMILVK